MPDLIPDLWPDDIAVTDVVTPLAIMGYQAGQLRARTQGLLEGEVQTALDDGWTHHYFDLIAPALDRYRYRLFTARHRNEMVYPVIVESVCLEEKNQGSALLQALKNPELLGEKNGGPQEAATQREFIELVGRILRSNHAKSVIQSLIAQSNDRHKRA